MTRIVALVVSIAAFLLGACFIAGMSPSSGIKADNPLGAQPLTARSRSDVFAQSEKDCSFWPLENEVEVSATDAQICVSMTVLKEAPSDSWSGPPPIDRTKFVKILSNSRETGSSMQIKKKRESKIGTCRGKSVWSFSYKGCQANEGTLTADTTWLSAGTHRWRFKEDPAPATSEEPAPAAN